MDTVLTDDEIDAAWNGAASGSRKDLARSVEAAVLAKLREQEPRPCHVFNLTKEGNYTEWEPTTMAFALPDGKHALYTAAPLPAVVQVPAPWREAVKVAREALKTCERFSVSEWEVVDMTPKIVRASLAQLDSLEGGE